MFLQIHVTQRKTQYRASFIHRYLMRFAIRQSDGWVVIEKTLYLNKGVIVHIHETSQVAQTFNIIGGLWFLLVYLSKQQILVLFQKLFSVHIIKYLLPCFIQSSRRMFPRKDHLKFLELCHKQSLY